MRDASYHIIKFFDEDDNCVSETIPLMSYTEEIILETKYKFRFYRFEIENISSYNVEKVENRNNRKKKSIQELNSKVTRKFLN